MDPQEATAIVDRLFARIRFGVTLTLRITVLGVGGTFAGLTLRLSWGYPDLLVLEGCLVAAAVMVWTLPEEDNPIRWYPTLVKETLILQGLRVMARYLELKAARLRAAENRVARRAEAARARWKPQREPDDIRVYPPQT